MRRDTGFRIVVIGTAGPTGTQYACSTCHLTVRMSVRAGGIFILRQKERTLRTWLTEGLVQQIVNLAQDMQVTVVADRSTSKRGA